MKPSVLCIRPTIICSSSDSESSSASGEHGEELLVVGALEVCERGEVAMPHVVGLALDPVVEALTGPTTTAEGAE